MVKLELEVREKDVTFRLGNLDCCPVGRWGDLSMLP